MVAPYQIKKLKNIKSSHVSDCIFGMKPAETSYKHETRQGPKCFYFTMKEDQKDMRRENISSSTKMNLSQQRLEATSSIPAVSKLSDHTLGLRVMDLSVRSRFTRQVVRRSDASGSTAPHAGTTTWNKFHFQLVWIPRGHRCGKFNRYKRIFPKPERYPTLS